MTVEFYHYAGACSLGALIALEESDLPFDLHLVDLTGDRPEYRKTSPSGKVRAGLLHAEVIGPAS